MAAFPVFRSSVLALVSVSAMACDQKPTSPSPVTQTVQTVQTPPPAPAVPLNVPFVFYSYRSDRDELVIVDREGGDLRVLARGASRPDWSRDGRIAFDSRAAPQRHHHDEP